MRTPEDIKSAIGIEDLVVRTSENGEYYFASLTRNVGAWHQSHAMRVMPDATDEQLAKVRQAFEDWWKEEQE